MYYDKSQKKIRNLWIVFIFCYICCVVCLSILDVNIEHKIKEKEYQQKSFVFQAMNFGEFAMEDGAITEIRIPKNKQDIIQMNEKSDKIIIVLNTELLYDDIEKSQ